jgi:hypothetical protein
MVTRTRPDRGELIVVFSRDNQEPKELSAVDGYQAAGRATTAIATGLRFLPGDIMIGRLADGGLTRNPGILGDLPEV